MVTSLSCRWLLFVVTVPFVVAWVKGEESLTNCSLALNCRAVDNSRAGERLVWLYEAALIRINHGHPLRASAMSFLPSARRCAVRYLICRRPLTRRCKVEATIRGAFDIKARLSVAMGCDIVLSIFHGARHVSGHLARLLCTGVEVL